MKLRIGARESSLGVARGEQVADALKELGHEIELVLVSASLEDEENAQVPGEPLAEPEDYAAKLRQALRAGECDVAVHSVKDIPLNHEVAEGLKIVAVPARSDHREALVSVNDLPLAALPQRSRVGTSSLRRIAQLRAVRPDLTIVEVSGSLNERIRRVQPGDLDAVVVSMASLDRLGLSERASEVLGFLPAPGQGAMALECRADDTEIMAAVAELNDLESRICVTAERVMMGALGLDYRAPLAAHAGRDGILTLKGGAFSIDGAKRSVLQLGIPTSMFHAGRAGRTVAAELSKRGVKEYCNPEAVAAAGIMMEHDEESPSRKAEGVPLLLPRQEGTLSRALREVGFNVETMALQHASLISADNILGWADWVVFPSAHTVWAMRERGWTLPEGVKVAALGDTTRRVLEESGYQVDLCPSGTASSAKVIELFPQGEQRVVILCAEELSTKLEDGLRVKGYEVERLPIYRMAPAPKIPADVLERWQAGAWEAVLLTAPSLVAPYLDLLGHRPEVKVLAWDQETADELARFDIQAAGVAPSKDSIGTKTLGQIFGLQKKS